MAWGEDGGQTAFAAIVAGRSPDAIAAVAATGGRLLAQVATADLAGHLATQAARPIVLLDLRACDDCGLAALPEIGREAAMRRLPVVAALDPAQIDRVAAVLQGPQVDLLVAPSPVDWAAAVLLAGAAGAGPLHDRLSEGEAARLARLNQEVARIADVLSRLSRQGADEPAAIATAVADRHQRFDVGPCETSDAGVAAADVRRIIRARRLRDRMFEAGMFEDPGWDMILDLYAAQLERVPVSVSSLCIASAVAPTTALRWIARMTEAGLFERSPDPFDKRRAFLSLSRAGLDAMARYVAAVREAGLPLV